MKKMIGLIIAFLWIINAQAAPNYIELKPLDKLLHTSVGDVSSSENLPIITWGGDIATIYANGNQRKTSSSSIFAKNGLKFKLTRQDVFSTQVENYMAGRTPFLRGTLGMISSASDILSKNPKTKPVVFYQMTWSAGGDALVVKNDISKVKDLKGKTIAIQAYGPHVDYLTRILADAGLKVSDIRVRWLPDLTGTDNSPMAAFYESDIDAAFVIIPDALALTSGGNVGTGSEDSVKNAKILMSTKTANRVIADVYAVRSDYYNANKPQIHSLTRALMEAEEKLGKLVSNRGRQVSEYKKIMAAAGDILLDSPEAISDTEGLYADSEFIHLDGNVKFFSNSKYPRRMEKVSHEIYRGLTQFGLVSGKNLLMKASINYKQLGVGISTTTANDKPRFKQDEVSKLVTKKQQQNSLAEGELFSFDVFFKPNQKAFSIGLYQDYFSRVIDLAATYGGAIISVEGHSDPMGYLKAKKKKQPSVVLGRIKQSARNLSQGRAQSVRDAIVAYSTEQGISMDTSQFATVGHGIAQPNTGICGSDPCAPKNAEEWRSNMRVKFRIIQVEAESNVFSPL